MHVNLNCNNDHFDNSDGACNSISFNASHATQTNINCIGRYSCLFSFDVSYGSYINITANDDYSLYSSTIYGNYVNQQLNVNCSGQSSCHYTTIYANNLNELQTNTSSASARYLAYFIFQITYIMYSIYIHIHKHLV